ncbi:TniB family NTP-binding protein [Nocardia sp. CA2R105]|uniref:AAA family ATPase n=1 Tax=Nocardia coffeae TaxID=2873381 RepID=UPI001CA795FA|nr:TniB family NTP-binding protein [Nocardia coffeae]MBY8858001.1 TniB family NTP-binding protein [Nocardia coffeae]
MVQFILPEQVPDRETFEGWTRWRLTRHSFIPAPRISSDEYELMRPREQQLHDLHRAATHANLPMQDTPMSNELTRVMRARLQNNALKLKPNTRAGLMITGGGFQGKTETACEIAAAFEDSWLDLHNHLNPNAIPGTRDLHVPVAYVQTPVTAKPKSTCQAILDFYGAEHKNMTLPQLTRQVRASLHDHGTRVLILDDITRLKMHRADDQDTLDLLRAFMSMNTTLVLIGVDIPRSGLLRAGKYDKHTGDWIFPPPSANLGDRKETQTERRFKLIHLEPFRYHTAAGIAAWTNHLDGLQQSLRLFASPPDMLTGGRMPEYLFRRTNGVVGLLELLVEEACTEAIATGTETITEQLLDSIALNLGDVPGRPRIDNEIPDVPSSAPPKRRRSRPRNTVFDDRGLPPDSDSEHAPNVAS